VGEADRHGLQHRNQRQDDHLHDRLADGNGCHEWQRCGDDRDHAQPGAEQLHDRDHDHQHEQLEGDRVVRRQPRSAVLEPVDDSTTGTATCNGTISISSGDSNSVTVGIYVDGWYFDNSPNENTIVTVSHPLTSTFITGGGYLVLSSATSGIKAGNVGSKNNFG